MRRERLGEQRGVLAPQRLALLLLLLGRLALGFAYSAANPLGEAPDEADHYAYAASIGREGRLPVGTEMTQAKHPPLYHILAGIAGRPAGLDFSFLRSNPDVTVFWNPALPATAPNFFIHTSLEDWPWRGGALSMHLGRLVSVLAGVILVAATYGLGRLLWPAQPYAALIAAAFVAFLPESLFIGGSMSNDMLAATLPALAMLAALWGWSKSGAGMAVTTGVFMALAFLTKVSTVALWPVAVLLLVAPPGRVALRDAAGRAEALRRVPHAVIASFVALLGVSPWLWRNWRLYGDPLGTPLVLATIDQRTGPLTLADFGWLFKGWFLSFWGKFGGAGHIPLPAALYVLWGLIVLAAVAGWAVRWRRCRREGGSSTTRGWLVLAAAPVLTAFTMIAYSRIALGTDQGRLLFPALAPIGLLIAGGIAGWAPQLRRAHGAVWTGGLAVVAVLALLWGIVIPFAPPPAPPASTVAQAEQIGETWPGGLTLQAVRWPGDEAPVLYWRTKEEMPGDLRVEVRLSGADGAILWEWRRSPGAGRFSTDRWPANGIVADAYPVPPEVLAAAQRLEIGVYEFGSDGFLVTEGGERVVAVEVGAP